MDYELDEKALSVIAKVEKCLAIANHPTTSEEEAAAATATAQKLLAAHNLDMAIVEKHSGKTGKRADNYLNGGLYKWQRDLWNSVATLNFCRYWYVRGNTKGSTYQHRVLGRPSNVRSTQLMSEYLQQTIERHARARVDNNGAEFFTKANISFREGMAHRIVQRLGIRREEQLAEAKRQREEEQARSRHPAYSSSSTALVLMDAIQAENDANEDYLHGEGYSARSRAEAAQADAEYEARVTARQKWIEEHPDEYKAECEAAAKRAAYYDAQEAKRAKRRKTAATTYRGPSYKGDIDAYREGLRRGSDVGLDTQIGHKQQGKLS